MGRFYFKIFGPVEFANPPLHAGAQTVFHLIHTKNTRKPIPHIVHLLLDRHLITSFDFFKNNLVSKIFTKYTRSQSKLYSSFCRPNSTKQTLK